MSVCKICEKPTTKKCANCHQVYYCGKEHQIYDWKNGHKQNYVIKKTNMENKKNGQNQISKFEKAVRDDIMTGEVPIPVKVCALKRANQFARNNGGFPVEITCWKCGSKDKDRYSVINKWFKNGLKLECIDCLVEIAKEANITISQITNFVDNRYCGAIEACAKIQNLF